MEKTLKTMKILQDVGAAVLGLLTLVSLFAFTIYINAWVFMLTMGVLHSNIHEAIPPIGFGESIAPATLISLFYLINSPRRTRIDLS